MRHQIVKAVVYRWVPLCLGRSMLPGGGELGAVSGSSGPGWVRPCVDCCPDYPLGAIWGRETGEGGNRDGENH